MMDDTPQPQISPDELAVRAIDYGASSVPPPNTALVLPPYRLLIDCISDFGFLSKIPIFY